MFILYINDISEGVTSSVKLFADDCLLFRRIRSPSDSEALQADLDRLTSWARTWQMSFNPDKCSVLTITLKKNTIQSSYTMLGQTLQHCDHHPYLGVELASDMSWNHHIKGVTAKAQRSLNMLRRNLSGCSQETKARAYTSMVRPILEYAGCVWDPYHKYHIKAVEAVQRRAARFVCRNYDYEADVKAMVTALGWRTLQERRFISRQCMLYKAIHGLAACNIPSYFPKSSGTTRTSHNQQHVTPKARIEMYGYSYFPRTIRTWNILPAGIVELPKIDCDIFKTELQRAFNDGQMYMVIPPKANSRSLEQRRQRLGSTRAVTAVGPVY